MSHTPIAKRMHLICMLFFITFSALPRELSAFTLFSLNDVFVEIMRPQAWEPEALIRSVAEQERAQNVSMPMGVVAEEGEIDFEEEDFSDAMVLLFQEEEPPTIFSIPIEIRVTILRYLPYGALYSAVQARIFSIREAFICLSQLAHEACEQGQVDLLALYLEEALGLLYQREALRVVDVMSADLLALFAEDVYGIRLAGENATPPLIAADLYKLWTMVLLDAIQSDIPEVRSRAYCELGFVVRLNALSEHEVLVGQIFEILFHGLSQLGYPEFLSLMNAFMHPFHTDAYSEQVKELALGCLLGMVFCKEAEPFVDTIGAFLVDLYERDCLKPEYADMVDKLFIHPEKLFRLRLM